MYEDLQLANFWISFILALIMLLAVVVALFGKRFWDWVDKPIIKFGLDNKEPHVIQTYAGDSTIIKYFRLRIINEGRTVAKNCHIKLISAMPLGKKLKCPLVERDKLKWSNAPMDSRYSIYREKIDISPSGGCEFCDLFRLESTFMTEIKFMSFGERTVPIQDEYIITIEISGDNFRPRRAKIRTSLPPNGFWNTQIGWAKDLF